MLYTTSEAMQLAFLTYNSIPNPSNFDGKDVYRLKEKKTLAYSVYRGAHGSNHPTIHKFLVRLFISALIVRLALPFATNDGVSGLLPTSLPYSIEGWYATAGTSLGRRRSTETVAVPPRASQT